MIRLKGTDQQRPHEWRAHHLSRVNVGNLLDPVVIRDELLLFHHVFNLVHTKLGKSYFFDMCFW